MPSWRIYFSYGYTKRAANGLTIEAWSENNLLRLQKTDGTGYAGNNYEDSETLKDRRGVHPFSCKFVVPNREVSSIGILPL